MAEQLTQYGNTFQLKIIASLLSNKVFIQTINDILLPEMFDSPANAFLVETIIKYYVEYKTIPTLEVLKVKINETPDDVLKVSIIENLKNAWKYINSSDLSFIQDEILSFCKNQVLKSAIIESVTLLENQKYDQIKQIIDSAMTAGAPRDLGHKYIEELNVRLDETSRSGIKLPWDCINEITDGGLGPGELGVIVAPAGIGKSWLLQAIGAHAVKSGKTVIHYTLELKENYVGLRYDTIFTSISTSNIKYYKDDVNQKIHKLTGNLLIKYYPTRSASIQTITSHLKICELQNIKPDMIIVDYADLLKYVGGNTRLRTDEMLGIIYAELRGLGGEFDVPVWSASQANRSATEEEVIEAGKISASYEKIMVADFVMSLSRKVEDKIANTGRCHIIKNRFGPDGITFPMNMNTELGKIDIYAGDTTGGQVQQKKMDNSQEYLRKKLAEKYSSFKADPPKVSGFE